MKNGRRTTIGEVCSFLNGGTPSKSVERYFQGDIPWITGADITSPVVTTARSFITKEAVASSATNRVPAGTVLLVTRTSVGKVATAGVDLCFSQDITALTPDASRLHASYLVEFLKTQEAHFERQARGATIKGITRQVVGDMEIPVPPLAEQRRIAEVLDRAEALRAKRRAALAQLDSLPQSLFLDLFGDTRKESKHPQRVLDECAEVVSGIAKGRKLDGKKKVEAPYLRVANVQAGFLNLSEIKTIEALPSEVAELALKQGDVVLTEGGDHDKLGRGAMWDGQIEGCIHQNHVFRVRPNHSLLLPRFFHEFLQAPAARAYFLRCAKRTTNLASINMTQLRALPVPLPPIPLQREFARRVTAVEALKTAQRASLAELDALFATLQHRAFKGEL